MLCPYRKTTINRSLGNGKSMFEEQFSKCHGEDCPFYSFVHGGCVKVDYDKTMMIEGVKIKQVY